VCVNNPLRKFQLCANAVAPGKLRVGLKIAYLTNRVLTRASTRKIPTRTFATCILPGPTKHRTARTGREIAAGKAQINYRDPNPNPNLNPNPCGRCSVLSHRILPEAFT